MSFRTSFCFLFTLFISSCRQPPQLTMLELLSPGQTGIYFSNEVREDERLNILTFEYFYNGAGVGVGDFNRDGLADIFFSSNMGQSRLYLNEGNFSFRDITDSSGINTLGKWATGVSVADVNQDGYPDIYLCFAGPHDASRRQNALFINNRNNTFSDSAQAYNLADTGHSVQAVFFDYDKDSDLDMYLLTNSTDELGPNIIRRKRTQGEMANTDRLYRNNGDGTFTNVSREAGITIEGYGLGVSVTDINEDGWPDVYVSNDYVSNDLFYINNRDGTFSDKASGLLQHTSYSAMGNDIADFNNDGRPDILTVDMLPPDQLRQKIMLGATNHDRYRSEIQYGYAPQFMRNTLQLNRGPDMDGTPTFSEIGHFAGIDATDWSWSGLFADIDNDGWRDILITNGYPRDITDRDFMNYTAGLSGGGNFQGKTLDQKTMSTLSQLDGAHLNNFIFSNQHNLTFQNVSADWGFGEEGYSTGSAYADLDNDGDLDLIVNNTNKAAFIYRNNADSLQKNHFLKVALTGPPGNLDAFGTRIIVHLKGTQLVHEHYPVRGYLSTVDGNVHFGLGSHVIADSLEVVWPDAQSQVVYAVRSGQTLEFSYQQRGTRSFQGLPVAMPSESENVNFDKSNDKYRIHFNHRETPYTDFNHQPLLPHKFSQGGPGLAVADVNGDGLEDFFVGGAYNQSGMLFYQTKGGTFTSRPLDTAKKYEEDMGALFFDADNDGDSDLYVVSGGNEFPGASPYYQDRLYINDGNGQLILDKTALPANYYSGSCVTASDFDADGDLDLFVGGRLSPQQYPLAGGSQLLRNDGGKFTDVTDKMAPGLKNIGLVNAGVWCDVNNDGTTDLVIAGEWMPITMFLNNGSEFINTTVQLGLGNTIGWWNSIQTGDFNGDGKTDFVLGNHGTNSRYKTSALNPLIMYTKDFSQSGIMHGVITYEEEGRRYPLHPRDDLFQQLPGLRKKFPLYRDYAKATIHDLFSEEALRSAVTVTAATLESSVLINHGDSAWKLEPLCGEAQFAPVFGILVNDYDEDGVDDLLLSGNDYSMEVLNGQLDAFKGLLLKGQTDGSFTPVQTRVGIKGDGKALASLHHRSGSSLILAAQNNDSLLVLDGSATSEVRYIEAEKDDAYALLTYRNGRTKRKQLHYGSGYLSQSSRRFHISQEVKSVEIYKFNQTKRSVSY